MPQSDREGLERVYLEKQPHMREFLSSPLTAFIKVDVESYVLVSRFEEVAWTEPENMTLVLSLVQRVY